MSDFIKIRLVLAELFHADGRTDTIYFSVKPTDALVSKFILVQSSTCFG